MVMKDVFIYDYKVLVEVGIKNLWEIEILILGNENLIVFKLGGIWVLEGDEFYDYENKFVDVFGVVFDLLVIVDDDLVKEIIDMVLKVYEVLGMKGMVWIDFLVDEDGVLYLGELNMLLGFINIFLYL